MSMDPAIAQIIKCGSLAPSGGNSQPWHFHVAGNTVEVFATPEKDHRILNFRNRGTWVAHGALLENMLIAASALGYRSRFDVFPDKDRPEMTVRVSFEGEKGQPASEPLYSAVSSRTTNRKRYRIESLSRDRRDALLAQAAAFKDLRVRFVEDRETIRKIGSAASVNEIITLENRELHQLFVKEIAWSAQEEEKRGGGLFIKTMELKPPQEAALKGLFKHWSAMSFLNKLRLARKVAQENAEVYAAAPLMGAIIVSDTDRAFFDAGRAMERIWLAATGMSLSFQLLTGILFMHQRIRSGDNFGLSEEHRKMAEDAYRTMADAFGAKEKELLALVFRIGEAPPPNALSIKRPVSIIT